MFSHELLKIFYIIYGLVDQQYEYTSMLLQAFPYK